MSNKRVPVLAPDGTFGFIDESDVPELPEGARVLTKAQADKAEAEQRQQAADAAEQERYAALPTARKVLGGAATAAQALINPLSIGSNPDAPTEAVAFNQGVTNQLTGGLAQGATRQAIQAVGGKEAAEKYAQGVEQQREASPYAYGAGQFMGAAGGLLAPVGAAVEAGAAARLGGLAAKGVAGRAAATALEMGVRGAVEGGAMKAGEYVGDELLADRDLAADKLFAATGTGALYGGVTGTVLGGAGSLAKSGIVGALARRGQTAKVAAPKLAVSLSGEALDAGLREPIETESPFAFGGKEHRPVQFRPDVGQRGSVATESPFSFGEGGVRFDPEAGIAPRGASGKFQGKLPATDALKLSSAKNVGREVALREGIDATTAEATATPIHIPEMHATEGPAASLLSDLTTEAGTKARAYDRAWKAIGGGFGLQSTSFAGRAEKFLPNGTRDVGEVLMRKGIIDPNAHWVDTMKDATPTAMLPRISAAVETVGRRIGEITDASGGRVDSRDIVAAIRATSGEYRRAAATRPIADAIDRFGIDLQDSLGINQGRATVAVQDLLRERKALDLMVFENAALNPNVTTQVKRDLRARLEGLVVDSLDRASGQLKGELASEYKALKKDYLALNIAEDVATDSAARAQKHAFLGLSSLTFGHGSIVKSLAHKVVRERGDAVAATWLYQTAERGTLARTIGKIDLHIDRASKGLIAAPAKGALKAAEVMPPVRSLAKTGIARVAAFQADPQAYVEHVNREVEPIAAHSPEIADSLVTRQVRAMTFLSSKLPIQGDKDPLDPHEAPSMTPVEEAEFGRYVYYTDKPQRFFAEVARGKITPEGAETARELMPRAFEELQAQTAQALVAQLSRGVRLPFRQRQLLGQLLDFAATPSQRPDHRAFLQQNVADVLPSDQSPSAVAPAKSRRVSITPSGSALDRLEAGGPGHR